MTHLFNRPATAGDRRDSCRIPGSGIFPWRRDRIPTPVFLATLLTQTVKNLPARWATWVRSLDWEDPVEEGMATHSIILAWRIPIDRGAW